MQPAARYLSASALALLALLTVLAAAPAGASAESGDAADPETVTTVLHPGWNMVGWLGTEAPATDLFEAIPGLMHMSAWDALHQRYQSLTRTSVPRYSLERLTPGMGLWLRLGGDAPFEWVRPASSSTVLLSLREGRNLVSWTGSDGTHIEDALARFGDSVVRAYRWDAGAQAYEHYLPNAPSLRNTIGELNHGDAIRVDFRRHARWWQSGARGVEFTFPDSVPAKQQAAVRAGTASVITFFAERYGVAAPELKVVVDLNLTISAGTLNREILIGPVLLARPDVGATLAHEYFHVLQGLLATDGLRQAEPDSPGWMTEGAASYAAGLYWQEQSGQSAREQRHEWLRHSLGVTAQLKALERPGAFYEAGPAGYNLAALAVGWLSGYAVVGSTDEFDPLAPDWPDSLPDGGAHIEFYRALASAADWEEAFVGAFGLRPDTFYESFEAYRRTLAGRLHPHLADNTKEPVLVLVGDIPDEAETAVRTRFATMLELYATRLAADGADYTVYIGADAASLADIYLATTGNELPEQFCDARETGIYVIVTVDCVESRPWVLLHQHSLSIQEHLAPWESLQPVESPYDRRGPMWLLLAIEAYAYHAAESALGPRPLDQIRSEQIPLARYLAEPLAAYADWDGVLAAGYWRVRALSWLVGEVLAERAGEPALFDYFRHLLASDTWEAAFEAAFGMSVDDFHAEFGPHRAEVAPPYVLRRIHGRVTDADGNPAAAMWVAAKRGELRWEDTTTTGADGTFELAVRDGHYHLNVDLTTSDCLVDDDDRQYPGGTTVVDGSNITGIVIRLPDGSSCAGS